MSLQFSESFLSPNMLLWMASAVIGAVLLLGLMNRRRTKLTESLREYVNDNNKVPNNDAEPPNNDTVG